MKRKWIYVLIIAGILLAFLIYFLTGNNNSGMKILKGAYEDLLSYYKGKAERHSQLKPATPADVEKYEREQQKLEAVMKKTEEKIKQLSDDELSNTASNL